MNIWMTATSSTLRGTSPFFQERSLRSTTLQVEAYGHAMGYRSGLSVAIQQVRSRQGEPTPLPISRLLVRPLYVETITYASPWMLHRYVLRAYESVLGLIASVGNHGVLTRSSTPNRLEIHHVQDSQATVRYLHCTVHWY